MSIDHSWTAKYPGVIPLPMIRGALEKANRKLAPQTHLELVGGDDEDADPVDEESVAMPGAVFMVRAKNQGHITLFQPDDEAGTFHMGISSTTEGRGRHFDELAETADTLAGCIGMVVDYDDDLRERLDELASRGPQVEVVSVRVEIGIDKEKPRVVAIEGSPLAKVEKSKLEALDVATLRAVSYALTLSSQADGRPSFEEIVKWAEDAGYRLDETDEEMAYFEVVDDDGEVRLPRVCVDVTDDAVDISAFPELEMDPEQALEHNEVELQGPSRLSRDSDGVWTLTALIRREKLDRSFFLETLEDFVADLEELVDGHGTEDEDDEEEAEDEEEGEEGEGEEEEEEDVGEAEGLSLEDLVTWAVRGDYERNEPKEDAAWIDHVDDEGDVDLPTITLFLFRNHVHIVAYPALELGLEDALRKNERGFHFASRLAIDEDGDWAFRTALSLQGLDEASFMEVLDAFSSDLAELITEHPAPEEGGDAEA